MKEHSGTIQVIDKCTYFPFLKFINQLENLSKIVYNLGKCVLHILEFELFFLYNHWNNYSIIKNTFNDQSNEISKMNKIKPMLLQGISINNKMVDIFYHRALRNIPIYSLENILREESIKRLLSNILYFLFIFHIF